MGTGHDISEMTRDRWIVKRGIGKLPAVGVVPQFEKSPGRVLGPSPLLGQHAAETLRMLGYSPEEISSMITSAVVEVLRKDGVPSVRVSRVLES